MCAQFALKIQATELSLKYGIHISEAIDEINSRFLPSQSAPVIAKENSGVKLTGMRFGLIPSWSKEPKVKFATHNARLETIVEKPTWQIPFRRQHIVVPMTAFFESVYTGSLAGNIISFHRPAKSLLFAAGIFDYWKNPEDSEQNFFSFSILTQDPSPFILDNGHDRTPIFIKDSFIIDWINLVNIDEKVIKSELSSNAYHPELEVSIDRALKPGWENRK